MSHRFKIPVSIGVFVCGFLFASDSLRNTYGQASSSAISPVTNLLQLSQLLISDERLARDLHLEATVCDASQPTLGVVILQDSTGTELFQFSGGLPELSPGDKIRINRKNCWLRRRDTGVQVSVVPVVDNNGVHAKSTSMGGIGLKKGRHSLTLEWFNYQHPPGLEVKWQVPGSKPEEMPFTNLFCNVPDERTGGSVVHPGLVAECYEGTWERVPNFDLLAPVKTAIVTNFDLDIRTREESVGIRFRGFFDAPVDGIYGFSTRSADGSLLFVDDLSVPVTKLGKGAAPEPISVMIDQPLMASAKQQWVTVEGRVNAIIPAGRGVELELVSEHNSLSAHIADAHELNTSNLLNSRIRVTGVGCSVFGSRGDTVLGRVFAVNAEDVETVLQTKRNSSDPSLLVKAEQVQTLTLEDARRHLPVQLRGVVTSKGKPVDSWLSAQDDTRGIFVSFRNVANSFPQCGDFYEIIGHSDAGDFAPTVVADRLVRLGKGELPQPIRPTWDELNNGSMDVQWVEFKCLVTEVHSNLLSVLLPAGRIDVQIEGPDPSGLDSLEKAVVVIRGVLFAEWNAGREVRVGGIRMRNAAVTVDTPPPSHPFDAVLKTPRELLLFDAQATAFRRVKVRGQVIYSDAARAFLQVDGAGIRLLPAEKMNLRPGDLIEGVGYPSIGQSVMLLNDAVVRKTGEAKLPPARKFPASRSELEGLDSTRVRIEGQLLGWHIEQDSTVLGMQSGTYLYLARVAKVGQFSLREGSQLALEGVYASKGGKLGADAFELLLNSPVDIKVLSQPSWWTLERLLILVGILVAILIFTTLWITQLRRVVEQRTTQLQREIHERERAEQQRALEVERSRIARDLHDDLGASLTEIAVLADKGRRVNVREDGIVGLLRTISAKARELVAAMDIIVWAVDPKDNSLQSAADYLCDFTDEFLSSAGIACRFDVPVTLPSVVLEGRCRHDLFLAVKETLNNIVRHAGATEVEFRITVVNDLLQIVIIDNGKGFDIMLPKNGKGLKSLPLRLAGIGGRHEIESTAGKGTIVKIELNLPMQKNNPDRG